MMLFGYTPVQLHTLWRPVAWQWAVPVIPAVVARPQHNAWATPSVTLHNSVRYSMANVYTNAGGWGRSSWVG